MSLLDQHSMQLLARYSYDNVVTFGGCQDDFMLVVTSDTEAIKRYNERASSTTTAGEETKLLFHAGKPQVKTFGLQIFIPSNLCSATRQCQTKFVYSLQILQITLLMADYMNMIGKTAPGTLTSTPVATPKNRGCSSRSSSRARGQLLTAPNTPRPDHKELTPRLSGVLSNASMHQRKWPHLDS